jgi:hypothetical protein
MALRRWRSVALLGTAVFLLISCAVVVAHAGPTSHAGCGLKSAEAARLISGLGDSAAIAVVVPDADLSAAQSTDFVQAAPGLPYPSRAAPPPDPRGPPSLAILSA